VTDYVPVTADEFAAFDDLPDWRYILGGIRADFAAPDFPAATALALKVANAAEAFNHHPDINVRYPNRVQVVLTTHAIGRLAMIDVELARLISDIASAYGVQSADDPTGTVEIAIDAVDIAAIRPFWRAVLGYKDENSNLVDPLRVGPAVWFQQMDEPRPQRNRIHIDVTVPHDHAEDRIAAALSAGGVMVSDASARSFWVLADVEGNEACVCTWQDR
jgi:4a-hydroxytetrahydrobiopterin dehydratase